MFVENNMENKITGLEKQITELQEKITKLEAFIYNRNYYEHNNYHDYNIKNEVNLAQFMFNYGELYFVNKNFL